MSAWEDLGVSGLRKYGAGEMYTRRMRVDGGWIYRFEDEIDEPSGRGGTLAVVRPSYVFVADRPSSPIYPRPIYPPRPYGRPYGGPR